MHFEKVADAGPSGVKVVTSAKPPPHCGRIFFLTGFDSPLLSSRSAEQRTLEQRNIIQNVNRTIFQNYVFFFFRGQEYYHHHEKWRLKTLWSACTACIFHLPAFGTQIALELEQDTGGKGYNANLSGRAE